MRDQAQADAERATSAVERLGPAITPESLRRFALDASCGTKMEPIDGTICLRLPSASRWSTRARFVSWAQKLNCYARLPPLQAQNQRLLAFAVLYRNGAPGQIRTGDLRLRRPTLYPAELRARNRKCNSFEHPCVSSDPHIHMRSFARSEDTLSVCGKTPALTS